MPKSTRERLEERRKQRLDTTGRSIGSREEKGTSVSARLSARRGEQKEGGGKFGKALDLLFSADPVVSGLTSAAPLIPTLHTNDLPDPLQFVADTLLSPTGIASIALLPVTGGGSFGLRAGAGAAVGTRGAAKELSRRVAGELAVSAVGSQTAKAAAQVDFSETPLVGGALQIAVPLLAGAVVGGQVGRGLNKSLLRARTSPAEVADALETVARTAKASGRTYIASLDDLDEVIKGITPANLHTDNPAAREVMLSLLRTGGSSKGIEGELGRNVLGWLRQTEAGADLATIAVIRAFPKGFTDFDMDAKGLLKQFDDQHWNKILSKSAKEFDALNPSPAQRTVYTATQTLLDELDELRVEWDLPPLRKVFKGQLFVPRGVKGVGDFEFRAPTDHTLNRLYQDATDAVVHGDVDYENPLQTLQLYAHSTYMEIAQKQLDDAISALVVDPVHVALFKDPSDFISGRAIQPEDVTSRGRAARDFVHFRNRQRKYMEQLDKKKAARVEVAKKQGELEAAQKKINRAPNKATRGDKVSLARRQTELDKALEKLNEARRSTLSARKLRQQARQKWSDSIAQIRKKEGLDSKWFGDVKNETVRVRKWKGQFLPENTDFARLESYFNAQTGTRVSNAMPKNVRRIEDLTNFMRLTQASVDAAMPFMQGLVLLARDPVMWWKMTRGHFKAMKTPEFQNQYIRDNYDSIQEMVIKGGLPLGDVEMFAATRGGRTAFGRKVSEAANSKVGRQVIGRPRAGYDTGLLMARNLMWQGMKPGWKGSERSLGETIAKMTGALSSRANGVGPNQRALEGLALYSPRLIRSTAALFLDAAKPNTPQGVEAIHSLSKLMAGSAAVMVIATIAAGEAEGLTQEEIERRIEDTLNPLSGKEFLSVRVGDNWYGVGGQVRSIAQALVKVVNDPLSAVKPSASDNPFLSFLASRPAPGAALGLAGAELVTDEKLNILPFETIEGPQDLSRYVGSSALPFWVQGALENATSVEAGNPWLIAGSEFVASRSSGVSPAEQLDDIAYEKFDKPYQELTPNAQGAIEEEHPELLQAVRSASYRSKTERERNERISEVQQEFEATQKSLMNQLENNLIDRRQLRFAIKNAEIERAAKRQQVDADLPIDFGESTTDKGKVLSAYYEIFNTARNIPDDPNSSLDFDAVEVGLAELEARIQAGEFGDPATATQIITERQRYTPPAEIRWFYDNKNTIRDSGYWDVSDTMMQDPSVLRRLERFGIQAATYSELKILINQVSSEGDRATLRQLMNIKDRVDELTSRTRIRLRRADASLDRALLENGHVTVPRNRELIQALR